MRHESLAVTHLRMYKKHDCIKDTTHACKSICIYTECCVARTVTHAPCTTHRDAFTYGVATTYRLLKIIGLFCKRALKKRWYSAKETCTFKVPTNRSHPICITHTSCLPWLICCHSFSAYIQDMTHSSMPADSRNNSYSLFLERIPWGKKSWADSEESVLYVCMGWLWLVGSLKL